MVAGTTTPISGATVDYYYGSAGSPPLDPMDDSVPSLFSSGGGEKVSATTAANGYYYIDIGTTGTFNFIAQKSGYNSQIYYDVYIPQQGTALNFYLTGGDDDGGSTCFLGGTKIATPDGHLKIEDITIGTDVLTFNENTGDIEENKVLKTFSHSSTEYLLINDLKVTTTHPIYVNGEIKRAEDIKIGDSMTGLNRNVTVTRVERISGVFDVYNLEIENNHNYYADGILVHNKYVEPTPPPGDDHACPFVHVWDGTKFVEDNNILPLSSIPERNELDVIDYYLIGKEAVPIDDNYTFSIQEHQTFQSHFDKMELAVIDYPEDYEIGVTTEGEWVTYSDNTISPISAVDSNGTDVLYSIVDEDASSREYRMNEAITLSFGNLVDISNAKLIIKRRGVFPSLQIPLDRPDSWYWLKHPIEIQSFENNEWKSVGILPTRVNWATGIVNISCISDYLETGGEIRLLITGGIRKIDYVALDISDNQPIDVHYYSPLRAVYNNSDHSVNFADNLLDSDGHYLKLDPYSSFEVTFPYESPTQTNRGIVLISTGYYHALPEIDIEQPVDVNIEIQGGSEGEISLWLEEVVDSVVVMPLQGYTYDLDYYNFDNTRFSFIYNPASRYRLNVRFDGCTEDIEINAEFLSLHVSQTLKIDYSPDDNSGYERLFNLDDILWNITGTTFDKFTGRFQVMKGTILQFDINEDYRYEVPDNIYYIWEFGDRSWTFDNRPTHTYSNLGIYMLNLTVGNITEGWRIITSAEIEVITSVPYGSIEVYQEIDMNLYVTGRKDNTVICRIFEDSVLINELPVTRTPGKPNEGMITFNKYLDREYEVVLVYDALHKGANPTWLTFNSGDNTEEYFIEFNTKDGLSQEIMINNSYLDAVLEGNRHFYFDAFSSYDIDGEIVSYEWNFGDGAIIAGELVQHTFAEAGTYEVTLTVMDDDGAIATVTKEITFQ